MIDEPAKVQLRAVAIETDWLREQVLLLWQMKLDTREISTRLEIGEPLIDRTLSQLLHQQWVEGHIARGSDPV